LSFITMWNGSENGDLEWSYRKVMME
jgi:hypothetical protein